MNVDIVLDALASGANTVTAIMVRTELKRESVRSAMARLRAVKAVRSTGLEGPRDARYSLTMPVERVREVLRPTKPSATALLSAWPMPVAFPPVVCGERRRNVQERV